MTKTSYLIIFSILFLLSCNSKSKENKSKKNGVTPTSELTLDSDFVNLFYKDNSIADSIKKEINNFYKKRLNKLAWSTKYGVNYSVSVLYNQLQNYKYDFSDSSFYIADLDTLIQESKLDEKKFLFQKNKLQKLDFLLTLNFFKFANKAYGGVTKSSLDLEWYIPRQKINYQATLDSLVLLRKDKSEQIPLNAGYFLLKKQLKKYRDLENNAGFPLVVTTKSDYILGETDSSLSAAKQYFYLTGDLKNKEESLVFTDSLAKAIRSFQQRMGLPITARLDSVTLIEINKPISFRIKQILINMERLRWAAVYLEKESLAS